MKQELEKQLFDKYPTLFPGGRRCDPKQSLMCFGFECGDGWFDLIDKLCDSILDCEEGDKVVVHQVKEKFGGLRFYTGGSPVAVDDLIRKAEELSYKTCETCGKPGKRRDNMNWIRTLCGDCKKNG